MNPEEDHPPNPVNHAQSPPRSAEFLTLETSAAQDFSPPDHGPQKPQIFPEYTEIDEDADPPLSTPKSPPITPHDAATHVTQPSVAVSRRGAKSKKLGPKWRGKKYQEKIEALMKTFKPIPFSPSKVLDFSRHEDLLKRLGLWEFVHVSFDSSIRSNLIVQLLKNFKKKERCSYVNGTRVLVNRADLARALKLPSRKKDKASSGPEIPVESAESIGFLSDFVSNWVILQDDMFMLPDNVISWYNAIQEGRFESLDWPDMMWFMVEKELMQGPALENCYYASHLQCLIRAQREELLKEETDAKEEDDEDVKMVDLEEQSLELSLGHETVDSVDVNENEGAASAEVGIIGKDESFDNEKRDGEDESDRFGVNEKEGAACAEEGVGKDETLSSEEHELGIGQEEEGNAEADAGEELRGVEHQAEEETGVGEQHGVADAMESENKEEEEQGAQWFMDGQFLRQCSFNSIGAVDMGYDLDKDAEEEGEEDGVEGQEMEEEQEEEGEEEDDDDDEGEQERFRMPSENLNNFEAMASENLMQLMNNSQMPFSSGLHVRDDSCGEFLASNARADGSLVDQSEPSIYGNPNKREMDDTNGLLLGAGPSKRMRTEQLDFNTCSENALRWLEKMRIAHVEKEQMWASSEMNQRMLINEVQQRDSMIEHLQRMRAEEQQKVQVQVYRLERELFMMEGLLEGYRKALKESSRAFAEYRAKCPQLDEPLYRDVPGSGGLVLSVTEIEKQRVKREEEERVKLVFIKDRIKEFEGNWNLRFEAHLEGVELLASKLVKVEGEMKAVKELALKRKVGKDAPEESNCEEKAEESNCEEKAEESTGQENAEESNGQETPEESNGQEKAMESVDEETAEESNGQEKAMESVDEEMGEGSVQPESEG